jgi:hypothetical protein
MMNCMHILVRTTHYGIHRTYERGQLTMVYTGLMNQENSLWYTPDLRTRKTHYGIHRTYELGKVTMVYAGLTN